MDRQSKSRPAHPARIGVLPLKTAGWSLLCLTLWIAGCKSRPASPEDDASLTQAVQTKLSSDSALTADPIQASVQQGIATLNGTVSNDVVRSLAANDAAQVPGIRTVVNNLTVQPPPAAVSPSSSSRPLKPERASRREKPSATIGSEAAVVPPAPPFPAATTPAPIERRSETALLPGSPCCPPPFFPAAAFRAITLPTDTVLPIRINQTLDSATAKEGDTFSGVLASDVLSDGLVVLPEGTPVAGRVSAVQDAAHFKGSSLLTIELTSLDRKGDPKGQHLPITTDSFSKSGEGRGKNTGEKIGGGAAIGAILGGILGGGKGAAIGAAAGGGTGAGVQAATRGQQVQIASETLVRFHLSSPIIVRVATGVQQQENGQQSNGQQQPGGDLQHHN